MFYFNINFFSWLKYVHIIKIPINKILLYMYVSRARNIKFIVMDF